MEEVLKCRICLTKQREFVNIFQKEEGGTVAQMFTECSGIEVRTLECLVIKLLI